MNFEDSKEPERSFLGKYFVQDQIETDQEGQPTVPNIFFTFPRDIASPR